MAEYPFHLRSIVFSKRELVEYTDGSRLVDENPEDGKGQLDYYTVSRTTTGARFPIEAVCLKWAPTAARASAMRETHNRVRDATESEESGAKLLFAEGKKFGEKIKIEFEAAVKANQINKDKIVLVDFSGFELRFPFKDAAGKERGATLYFIPRQNPDGVHAWILATISLNVDGIKVLIDKPEYLKSIEPHFIEHHKKLVDEAARLRAKEPTPKSKGPTLKPWKDYIP